MKQVHRLKFPAKLGIGKRAEAEFGKQFGGLCVCVCGGGGGVGGRGGGGLGWVGSGCCKRTGVWEKAPRKFSRI